MKTVGSGQSAATRCREFFLRRNSGQDDQPATLSRPNFRLTPFLVVVDMLIIVLGKFDGDRRGP